MKDDSERHQRRRALLLVVWTLTLFALFLALYVPRMNNYVLSDREFTGWTGPIAERLARGERPYIDFVLPIPPGSLVVLAGVQKLAGGPLLLQELWVAAISQGLMGLLAYAIASAITTRKNAVLVAIGTLVILLQSPKECAYDHTAHLFAWSSIALGLRAALVPAGSATRRWLASGALAMFTLYFKQSTAVGLLGGWVLALGYLLWIDFREHTPEIRRQRYRDVLAFGLGVLAALAAVIVGLYAVGTTPGAFMQAVFGDGPELKGGRWALVENLLTYVFRDDAIRVALVPTGLALALCTWMVRRSGVHAGDEPERVDPIHRPSALGIGASVLMLFGTAIALLAFEIREMNRVFSASVDSLRNIPAYGFVVGAVLFIGHLTKGESNPSRRRVGHAINALILVTMTCSLLHNTSFIHFVPFYYNNPTIALALTFLFMATARSRVVWATGFAFVLSVLPLFGTKLSRALTADRRVTGGHWAGMYVNYRGVELVRAARRVQRLAAPDETVLVLPEDVQLVGLIDRPRPAVKGAILFVDQYPSRLLKHDLAVLDASPPKIIVVHPRRRRDWEILYHTWSETSAAGAVLDHVTLKMLPKHYRLDSSYPTIYFWDQGQLDIWVRKDEGT